MKTNAFKGLFLLLLCLCLIGCGGKKAEAQKVEPQLPLGASYFPSWMKVAWRVSLEDSMVYVAMLNKAKTNKTMEMIHGLSPCLISYFENGQWKDVTAQIRPPGERYKKKKPLQTEENYVEADRPTVSGWGESMDLHAVFFPDKPVVFSISLYNSVTDSIFKGRYKLTFYVEGGRSYIVFEL